MRIVITEQHYDDQGNLLREIVTTDGVIVREVTVQYPAFVVEHSPLKAVPNE